MCQAHPQSISSLMSCKAVTGILSFPGGAGDHQAFKAPGIGLRTSLGSHLMSHKLAMGTVHMQYWTLLYSPPPPGGLSCLPSMNVCAQSMACRCRFAQVVWLQAIPTSFPRRSIWNPRWSPEATWRAEWLWAWLAGTHTLLSLLVSLSPSCLAKPLFMSESTKRYPAVCMVGTGT